MGSLADLDRRLSRKIEGRKTIQLTADDLDLWVVTGAYAIFAEAAEFEANPCDFPDVAIRPFCSDCCVWIYFIQAGDGAVKIGYSAKPGNRLWALQDSTADKLRVIGLFASTRATEYALHHFYAREHIRGEWFRPSLRLLAFARHVGIDPEAGKLTGKQK